MSEDRRMGIVMVLHALSAVSPDRAVEINKLAYYLNTNLDEIKWTIKSLIEDGYVERLDDRYYLTSKGIIMFSSMYT